jgi:serine/threonine protein kinase
LSYNRKMPEWIGKTIGRVQIEKLLARGGMAEVYLGTHLTLDRPVAVKVLHSFIEEEPLLLERFYREAKVVAGLRHANIVQIFDFDTTDGHPYIVMEFLRGPTLATYLRHLHQRKKRVPLDQVAHLLKGLTAAIDYAHSQGVIHRDIKPGNILFHSKNGEIALDQPLPNDVEAIVTDFGLVRVVNASTQTVSGLISGTPAYASPEQARGDQADHRTDIYSLGVVLYEMLAGRVPFEADNTVTILHMHIHVTPPPIPGIPANLQAIVDRALKKSPDERYQNSQAMAKDFYRAIGMTAQADDIPQPQVSAVPIKEPGEPVVSWLPKPEPPPPTPAPIVPETAPKVKPAITEQAQKPKPASKSKATPRPKPVPVAPEPASRPVGGRGWIGVGLISLVVLALAAGGYLIFGRKPPPLTQTVIPVATNTDTNPSPTPGQAIPSGTYMVQIPAGTYTVGRDPADSNHAGTQQIDLKSFYIDQYQTTNAEYGVYLETTGAVEPINWPPPPGEEKHPVRGVTWEQADTFCKWKNKRLPIEAEWEVAGRGKSKDPTKPPQLYPWGNDPFLGNSLPEDNTYEVDSELYKFNVSPLGLHAMVGNVWEWVETPYGGLNPQTKILRGGRFGLPLDLAYRYIAPKDEGIQYAGFRCAADQVR